MTRCPAKSVHRALFPDLVGPLLLIGGLMLVACTGTPEKATVLTHLVSRQDVDLTVSATGTVRAAESVKVRAGVRAKIAWLIPDGSTVVAGDKLVEFERDQIDEQLEQGGQTVEDRQRDLESQIADLAIYRLDLHQQVQKAEQKLTISRQEYQQMIDSTLPLEESDLELALERAQTDLSEVEEKRARMPDLLAKGFVTSAELRQAELDVKTSRQRCERARADLAAFRTYDAPRNRTSREQAVAEAELDLNRTRQQGERKLADKEATIDLTRRRLKKARDEWDELRQQSEQHILYAPAPGTVLHGDVDQWGHVDQIDLESEQRPQQVLLRLPNLSELIVSCEIPEADIARLAVDQPCTIRVPSLADRSFPGQLKHIAPTAIPQTRWDVRPRRYRVDIAFTELGAQRPRPDTSAEIEIRIGHHPAVIAVPIDAIETIDDAQTCLLADGTRQAVTIGPSSATLVIIESGLEAGQRIRLPRPGAGPEADAHDD